MERQYAEEVLHRGRVRLCAAGYYHALENAPDGVADPTEFRAVGVHLPIKLGPFEGIPMRRRLKAKGITLPDGANISLSGNRFIAEYPPRYLLCFTSDPSPGLFGEKYDTIMQVGDIEALAGAIVDASAELKDFQIGTVEYGAREFDIFSDTPLTPNPMVKAKEFAWQKEIRIVFTPSAKMSPFLFVENAAIAQLSSAV